VVEALLRLDPAIRDGAAHRHPRRAQELASAPPQPVPVKAQVFPTELNLVFLYIPSRSNEYLIRIVARNNHTLQILYEPEQATQRMRPVPLPIISPAGAGR
jgi:hypothetical protein